jgi:catechol 2,3-dioxygenase-like lactoylglutathione lyase family enzyme
MDLGAFSISLSVADMAASREFYGKLGFEMTGGDGETWTIMVNGRNVVGLFHGMFESNILTFNPGWSGPGEMAEEFTDVRELCARLEADGVECRDSTIGDSPSGPASFSVTDPDGNVILVDQHR